MGRRGFATHKFWRSIFRRCDTTGHTWAWPPHAIRRIHEAAIGFAPRAPCCAKNNRARFRKLQNNANIQKKVRLGIPGLPTATRYSRNALERTSRYSRNALEMTSSFVIANSKATLIYKRKSVKGFRTSHRNALLPHRFGDDNAL